jgi:nucleoid-associated protein YgaU
MDLDGVRQYVGSAAGGSRTWTVRRGDNLSKIAREVFGDERRENVMRIYNANRDKLESPHRLPVGVELSLPS